MFLCSRLKASVSLCLLGASIAAFAQAPLVPGNAAQAAAQRKLADEMRRTADQTLAAEQAACYEKFLVSGCLVDATKRHTKAMIEARKLDIPAREFQRDEKRDEAAANDAERDAERPRREAEQREQAERFRGEEEKRSAEREAKIAGKAKDAEEGRRKAAADAARHQAKLAERAKKDAERAQKMAEKRAKAAARAAAQTKPQ